MLKFFAPVLFAAAAQAAPLPIICFSGSKTTYTQLTAVLLSPTQLAQFQVQLVDGATRTVDNAGNGVVANPAYHPRKSVGYNQFTLRATAGVNQSLLLPQEIGPQNFFAGVLTETGVDGFTVSPLNCYMNK